MNFIVDAMSDAGSQDHVNQDSLGFRLAQTDCGPVAFAVLCDGMGGLSQGEVASASAAAAFLDWFDREAPRLIHNPPALSSSLQNLSAQTNRALYAYAKSNGLHLGTTVAVLLLTQTQYFLLHLGDTRVYSISHRLRRLSSDHTVLARDLPDSRITMQQLREDPRASVLLRCMGFSQSSPPDFLSGKVTPRTTFLLCTDGLYRMVPDADLRRLFSPSALPDRAAIHSAMEHALAQVHAFQERDDTSMLLIRTK